jgi:hypothetical protein
MVLTKGITVLSKKGIKGRIQINSGVQKALGYDIYNQMQFSENAMKPKRDWRKITDKEYKLIVTESHKNPSSMVSIHSLPSKIINLFKKLDLASSIHNNDAHSKFAQKKDIASLLSEALDSYLNRYSIKGHAKLHALVVMPTSLETTSFYYSDKNPEVKEYLGIHLDTSTEFKVYNGRYAKNRILINLGAEDRYFLFVNLTVNQLYKKLQTVKINTKKIDVGNLGESFFKAFPNYPILKITLKPYEFYIAPTDNCLHDGTTMDKTKNDVSISFLGNFRHQAIV